MNVFKKRGDPNLLHTDELSELESQRRVVEDIEYKLFKFGAFMSSRSGDIGPINVKK